MCLSRSGGAAAAGPHATARSSRVRWPHRQSRLPLGLHSCCGMLLQCLPAPCFCLAAHADRVCTRRRLPAEGECEEVYGAAHVLALGSTDKEWCARLLPSPGCCSPGRACPLALLCTLACSGATGSTPLPHLPY